MDDEESDGVAASKPAAKKTKITDFLGKEAPRKISKSMKPASPPKAKAKPKPSTVSDSEDDMMDYEVPKKTVPARTARAAPQKYIEIASDSEESGGDGSMFEDD